MSERGLVRFKELLSEIGPRFGLQRAASVGALWARWELIVGPDVAAHAEPTSLKDGILRVRTDSPTWATEIGYLVEEIKARANEALGTGLVAEVKVWTGPAPVVRSPGRQQGSKTPPEPSGTSLGGGEDRGPTEALEAAREAWERRRRGR